MQFALVRSGLVCIHYTSFTLVGYATVWRRTTRCRSSMTQAGPLGGTFSCFVDSEPFLLEINETA